MIVRGSRWSSDNLNAQTQRKYSDGARQQLNRLAFLGCVGVAAAVGVIEQSWLVFGAAFILTVGAALANSDIRLKLVRRRAWRRAAYR